MMAGRPIIRIVVNLAAIWFIVQAAAAAECGTPAAIGDGWQVATQESAGLDPGRLCELQVKLAATPEDSIHGVVVVRGGRLVFESYLTGPDQRWGRDLGSTPHGPDVKHDVRSISKSVTSLLVGIALDRKLIASVDEPAFGYFPEHAALRSPEKDRILLRQLLAMSSGIAWDESRPYSDPKNSEIQMIRAPDPYRYVLEQPLASAPDKVWNYSGGSTQLLAGIVQKAAACHSRTSPVRYCSSRWASPPSNGSACPTARRPPRRACACDRATWPSSASSCWTTANGTGGRLCPPNGCASSALPRLSSSYGYQWWTGLSVVGEQVIERVEAEGLGGQRIFIVPTADLVVVVTAGLYVNRGIDNQGEITNGILDDSMILAPVPHCSHTTKTTVVRPCPLPWQSIW